MRKHRIFIAINLPNRIKRRLVSYQNRWNDLPVRWTSERNLHITMVFLGYLDDGEIVEVCKHTHDAAKRCEPFDVKFVKVCLGPFARDPRMIWAEGVPNEALLKLRNGLEDNLFGLIQQGHDAKRNRMFKPHITMARVQRNGKEELKRFREEDISLTVPVHSVEVMESFLSRQGPDYAVLESVELGG